MAIERAYMTYMIERKALPKSDPCLGPLSFSVEVLSSWSRIELVFQLPFKHFLLLLPLHSPRHAPYLPCTPSNDPLMAKSRFLRCCWNPTLLLSHVCWTHQMCAVRAYDSAHSVCTELQRSPPGLGKR